MPSLLLVVFVLLLVIHLVNSVGAKAVNELLWLLYNKLPIPTSANAQKVAELQREVLRIKKEMSAISAQDDFAKWARIRRQHDKAVAEHEKAAATIQSSKAQFDTLASGARWAGTNGLRFLLQFWFSKTPMFWVPSGWVPGYVEWILSFPRAPQGSISIQVWSIACASVISLVAEAVVAVYALVNAPNATKESEKMAQAFKSGASTPGSLPGTPSKKEL